MPKEAVVPTLMGLRQRLGYRREQHVLPRLIVISLHFNSNITSYPHDDSSDSLGLSAMGV